MRKKIFVFCLMICFFSNLFSQVDPVDKEREGAGFAEFLMSGTIIDKQFGLLLGGGCGFITKKDIRIGAFYEGLTNNVNFHVANSENTYKFFLGYGGFWLGYPLWKSKRFHALTDLKLFFGKAATQNSISYEEITSVYILGFAPYFGAEFYISDHFAISLGVDYRISFFTKKIEDFKATAINSPNLRLGIKLGIFK